MENHFYYYSFCIQRTLEIYFHIFVNVKQLFKVNKYLANNKFRGGRVLQLITTVNQFYRACFITRTLLHLQFRLIFEFFLFFFFGRASKFNIVHFVHFSLSKFKFERVNYSVPVIKIGMLKNKLNYSSFLEKDYSKKNDVGGFNSSSKFVRG